MKTAVIIIDMQNAFFTGSFVSRGFELLNKEETITNIKKLCTYAQEKKWFIVFTKLGFSPDYHDAGLLVKKYPEIKTGKAYQGKDGEIIDALKVLPKEIIIVKTRYDSFYNTKLERVLKEKNIEKIICAGVLTNVCVESTVRSAFEKGFKVKVIKDEKTTDDEQLQNASLKTIEKHFGEVKKCSEIISINNY